MIFEPFSEEVILVTDIVEEPNNSSLPNSTFFRSTRNWPKKSKGFFPKWGTEAWQDLPLIVTTAQNLPRQPIARSFSVASPITA
jgi:hypothetical protein